MSGKDYNKIGVPLPGNDYRLIDPEDSYNWVSAMKKANAIANMPWPPQAPKGNERPNRLELIMCECHYSKPWREDCIDCQNTRRDAMPWTELGVFKRPR
jgi:hypothetical protein